MPLTPLKNNKFDHLVNAEPFHFQLSNILASLTDHSELKSSCEPIITSIKHTFLSQLSHRTSFNNAIARCIEHKSANVLNVRAFKKITAMLKTLKILLLAIARHACGGPRINSDCNLWQNWAIFN